MKNYVKVSYTQSPYNLAAALNLDSISSNIEEIIVDARPGVGEAQGVIILLPQIEGLGFYNTKIKVIDGSGNAQTNNVTVRPYNPGEEGTRDKINNSTADLLIAEAGGSVKLDIYNVNNWAGTLQGSAVGTGNLKHVSVVGVEIGTTYNCDGSEDVIGCDPTDGPITIVLALASRPVRITTIKDEGAGATANDITVNAHAGDTLDAATVITVNKGFAQVYNGGPRSTENFTLASKLA